MKKAAPIVWGGWEGHFPQAIAEYFETLQLAADYEVHELMRRGLLWAGQGAGA